MQPHLKVDGTIPHILMTFGVDKYVFSYQGACACYLQMRDRNCGMWLFTFAVLVIVIVVIAVMEERKIITV